MSKYLSNRQQNLKIGIVSYTENKTVLEVTGNVGIKTDDASYDLDVYGDINFEGELFQNGSLFVASKWITTAAGIHTLSNVGVGTTNPTSKLDVVGDVKISGITTTSSLVASGLTYPTSDGSQNQVLTTNGSGTLQFLSIFQLQSFDFNNDSDFGFITDGVINSDNLGQIIDAVVNSYDLGLLILIIAPNTFILPSFTVNTLPAANPAGQMLFVTDETGGSVPAFSDGTNFRRVTDRQIVS